MEWRQFATKIRMNDEERTEEVRRFGMAGSKDSSSVRPNLIIMAKLFTHVRQRARFSFFFSVKRHKQRHQNLEPSGFGRHVAEWGTESHAGWTISGTRDAVDVCESSLSGKEKTDDDNDETGESAKLTTNANDSGGEGALIPGTTPNAMEDRRPIFLSFLMLSRSHKCRMMKYKDTMALKPA